MNVALGMMPNIGIVLRKSDDGAHQLRLSELGKDHMHILGRTGNQGRSSPVLAGYIINVCARYVWDGVLEPLELWNTLYGPAT